MCLCTGMLVPLCGGFVLYRMTPDFCEWLIPPKVVDEACNVVISIQIAYNTHGCQQIMMGDLYAI